MKTTMSLHKRHFNEIAKRLVWSYERGINSTRLYDSIVTNLGKYFKSENMKFNPEKFWEATHPGWDKVEEIKKFPELYKRTPY